MRGLAELVNERGYPLYVQIDQSANKDSNGNPVRYDHSITVFRVDEVREIFHYYNPTDPERRGKTRDISGTKFWVIVEPRE